MSMHWTRIHSSGSSCTSRSRLMLTCRCAPKYADQPKFLDSELELYQSLKGLHALAAAPELYPTFVKSKCMGSLLGLLAHENADIANDTLELLQELATAEDASPDDLTCLIDAFLENDGAATLAHNLERLNDAEEDEGAGGPLDLGRL